MSADPLLQIDSLVTTFKTPRGDVRAVNGVSLGVERGQTVCIAGESGCGKSVTALSIMGLLPDSARVQGGTIRFNGVDLLALPPAERRGLRGRSMAMIFQEPMTALNPVLTVGHQIAEVFAIHGTANRREAREKVLALLRKVKIPDADRRYDEYPHQMSGGMRKRAQLAQTLVLDPPILLMDEPFSALDVQTRQMMENELLALWQGSTTAEQALGRKSVLFITHDLEEAISLSDRVVVLSAGPATRPIAEFPIDLPRPRDVAEIRMTPRFQELQERIWSVLRDEVLKAYQAWRAA